MRRLSPYLAEESSRRCLAHGVGIGLHELRATRHPLVDPAKNLQLGFAAVRPVDMQQFDCLLPDLQDDHANLLLASYDLNKTVAGLNHRLIRSNVAR